MRENERARLSPTLKGIRTPAALLKLAKYLLCLWMVNGIEQWAGIYSAFEKQLLPVSKLSECGDYAFSPEPVLVHMAPWQLIEDNKSYTTVTSSSVPCAFYVLKKVMNISRRKMNTGYIFYELYINKVYISWPGLAIMATCICGPQSNFWER